LKVSFSSHILRISLFTFERSRPLYSGNRFPIESAINKIVTIKILAKIVKSIIIIDEQERGRMGEWRNIIQPGSHSVFCPSAPLKWG
jgi:hypothetical protein